MRAIEKSDKHLREKDKLDYSIDDIVDHVKKNHLAFQINTTQNLCGTDSYLDWWTKYNRPNKIEIAENASEYNESEENNLNEEKADRIESKSKKFNPKFKRKVNIIS